MRIKMRRGILSWTLIIYLFAFQRVFTAKWDLLNYYDELFAIGTALTILFKTIIQKIRFTKEDWTVLFCWILVAVLGICSNILSNLLTDPFLISIDILSMVKVWLAYYTILLTNRSAEFYDDLIVFMAKIGRILVVCMFACLLISQFADIGMTNYKKRYGLTPFGFLFSPVGNYSKLFYFLIPLLTADLHYKSSLYKKTFIALALICWMSTLRSRAFAFVAAYLALAVWFFKLGPTRQGNLVKKIKTKHIVIIGILTVLIAWDKIIFYFTTDTQARSLLLRYGIVTLLHYFPFGSGFGTYGSDIAATHYSPLYVSYGFDKIRGMAPNSTMYLNDNYWPMVMGQFGFFGLLLAVLALFLLMKRILKDTQKTKILYFSSFIALGFLLLSSVASKSYSEFSSICVFMLLGVFVKRERAKHFREIMEK